MWKKENRTEVVDICRPATKYSPWFDVVLKSARLAVKTLTLLSGEVYPYPLPFSNPNAEPAVSLQLQPALQT
jgi:hypothetical protein